jgi:hypothetical protein
MGKAALVILHFSFAFIFAFTDRTYISRIILLSGHCHAFSLCFIKRKNPGENLVQFPASLQINKCVTFIHYEGETQFLSPFLTFLSEARARAAATFLMNSMGATL